MLGKLGYRVLVASGGREAVALYEKHQDQIALVMLDVVMPELSGPETADLIYKVNSKTPVIFATGYDMTDTLEKRIATTSEIVLRKPYDITMLSQLLKDMLQR